MSAWRGAFWVNIAAGAALVIIVGLFGLAWQLGLVAVGWVVAFLVLDALFILITSRVFGYSLRGGNQTGLNSEGPFYRDQDVRLGSLNSGLLAEKMFEGCRVIGPAVLLVEDRVDVDRCRWMKDQAADQDDLFIEASPGQRYLGAVRLRSVTFRRCVFEGVSIIADRQLIQLWVGNPGDEGAAQ